MALPLVTPRLTGFVRRLVDDGHFSEEEMFDALETAKKNREDIVNYLVEKLNFSSLILAETISKEFGEPLLDLAAYDQSLLPKNLVDKKHILNYRIIPLFQRASSIILAVSNPTNLEAIDTIRLNSKLQPEIVIVEHNKLIEIIQQNFNEESHFEFDDDDLDISFDEETENDGTSQDDLDQDPENEAPIVKYINKLLVDAIRMGASDLHFEPYEKSYRVRYRVDGILRQIATPPLQLANRLSSRLKVMSQMDISEKRVPQDGRIKLKLSKNKAIDFRVNSLPTLFGEKIVLRILDPSSAMLGIDALGYEPEQKALFLDALHQPQGMVLITGPTGSGKTVSLYTGLNILNTEDANISTAED
ncbi:ATPase, T2SS/T4P/T4SS family, partial [Acinetobacter nectaris]|uniref:ATPase, T2SS/T4P/T4SS family n=1 Tax=Acinetobacter nectaris TaxID=1219382 RepID=UPI001F16E32C